MDNSQILNFITTSIGNFGFPIVLTGYLLVRFEKKIETLNNTIQELLFVIKEESNVKKK